MTSGDDLAPGEVGRSLKRIEDAVAELRTEVRDRHHKISNEFTAVVGPMSTLNLRMTNAETQLERHEKEITAVMLRAAGIAGGIAVLGFLLELFKR